MNRPKLKPGKVLCPTPNPPYGQKMGIYKAKRLTGFSSQGFTLVEILVSILIFGIIVTTVFGSYRTVISGSQTINKGMNYYSMAERCLNRIIQDLQSIHVSLPPEFAAPEFDDEPDPYRVIGTSSDIGNTAVAKLRFTSFAHLPHDRNLRKGIAEIIYYVEPDNDRHLVLRRSDRLYPYSPLKEKQNDPLLCENLKGLTFTYYDSEGREFTTWDSDSETFQYETPTMIIVNLEVGDDTDSFAFETAVPLAVHRNSTG